MIPTEAPSARGAVPWAKDIASGGERDRQFVMALARGLAVLSCFGPERPDLSGTEIAGMLGLPQSTIWRLCSTMTKLGYLVADDGDRLRPALPVLRLGYTVLADLSPAEFARPELQSLADEFGGASGLAIRDGSHMRVLQRCESTSRVLLHLRIGSRLPVATSGLGWAYLAGLPEAEREAILAETRPEQRVWQDMEAAFRQAMTDYARDGYILNESVFRPAYNIAAVPVIGPDGRSAYALSCGGVSSSVSRELLRREIGPRLVRLADLLRSAVLQAGTDRDRFG